MKNDYGKGADKISIPPTLLFSLFGDHPDVRNTATSDFKNVGDRSTWLKIARGIRRFGSFIHAQENGTVAGIGGKVPALSDPERLFKSYNSLSSAINSGW